MKDSAHPTSIKNENSHSKQMQNPVPWDAFPNTALRKFPLKTNTKSRARERTSKHIPTKISTPRERTPGIYAKFSHCNHL